jgi:hypothetical protein
MKIDAVHLTSLLILTKIKEIEDSTGVCSVSLRSFRNTFKHDSLAYPVASSGDCDRYRIQMHERP